MKLLILRHAPAGDRATFAKTGRPDSERPLTAEGRRKMKKGAKGLRQFLPRLDVIATSPLTRSVQTASITRKAYGRIRVVELAELAPGGQPDDLLRRLKNFEGEATVALVGHEPYLSALTGFLLAGRNRLRIELKKGAACLLDCPGQPGPATATLLWALTPAQLRKLA